MIKRIMIVVVALMLTAPMAFAKKKKTVEIKNNLITDTTYGWTMNFQDNWKAKALKEPDVERVYLVKKNYSVNPNIQAYGGDYTIPSFSIFAQEFNGDVFAFEALLKRSLDEHKSENKIITKMKLLKDSDFITSGNVLIDSLEARQIYIKRNYKRVLEIRGSQKYINDHEVHEIYLVKKGSNIYVIHAYCEREFYETNAEEFHALIQSIDL